uniref:Uncharacterized protein n=1 Tax=Siphoviridae sp. ctmwf23 TaxID=2827935 RepID=A0A8S5T707_9CAUD|nr:MAG TPA: hypothetical protein [Siphoviridae sp. ctmwf23]
MLLEREGKLGRARPHKKVSNTSVRRAQAL